MKTILLLAVLGIFGYLAYSWYEKSHAAAGSAASSSPQAWPFFPTVNAPPQQFLNSPQSGPWNVPSGPVGPSYGIQP
jgi:hypothetical protein